MALDNGYYLFEDAQTEFVQEQAKKGFPIVLLLHNPLYEETLFNMLMNPNGESAGIVGVPEEKITAYPPYRLRQQKADEATKRALQYFSTETLIKAICAVTCIYRMRNMAWNSADHHRTARTADDSIFITSDFY